jgi:DNA polymerase III epsilon subunit-like protein
VISHSTNIAQVTFLAIDTEFVPSSKHVLELAAFRVCNGVAETSPIIDAFLKPGRSAPEARQILRTYEKVIERMEDAPKFQMQRYLKGVPFSSLVPTLYNLFSSCIPIAHNKTAEITYLKAEFARSGLPFPSELFLCTKLLAERLLSTRYRGAVASGKHEDFFRQHGLGVELGHPFDPAVHGPRHSALADAKHLAEVWGIMCNRFANWKVPIETLGDLYWLQSEDPDLLHSITEGLSYAR